VNREGVRDHPLSHKDMDFLNAYLNYISASNKSIASPTDAGSVSARNENEDQVASMGCFEEKKGDSKSIESPCNIITFDELNSTDSRLSSARASEVGASKSGREKFSQIREERKAGERREQRFIRFIAPLADEDTLTSVTLTPSKPRLVGSASDKRNSKESSPNDKLRTGEGVQAGSADFQDARNSSYNSSLSGPLKQMRSMFRFR
jgi:hypothetical protein